MSQVRAGQQRAPRGRLVDRGILVKLDKGVTLSSDVILSAFHGRYRKVPAGDIRLRGRPAAIKACDGASRTLRLGSPARPCR